MNEITEALKKIKGVSMVLENHQLGMVEDGYKDADYYFSTVSGFGQAQLDKVKKLLSRYGMCAYMEQNDTVTKINF